MKGVVFNIQRFSIHDGPGIRTVIFLKGCPLICPWCANPESQNKRIEIAWNEKKCKKCLNCVKQFPEIFKLENERIIVNQKNLKEKIDLIDLCINDALGYEGYFKTIDEIIEIALKDVAFYEESGGGVTISGGEVLAQPEFAISILKELKKHGIHTTAESTCHANPKVFKEFLDNLDFLIYDVKHYNEEIHKKITGVSLKYIKENIKTAVNSNKEILARIPIIPNFNYDIRHVAGFIKLFKELGIKKVELLPFHQFGENKYKSLNKKYEYSGVNALHKEDLKRHQELFIKYGIECKL